MLNNSRGQALVESTLVIPFFIIGFLMLFLVGLQRTTTHYLTDYWTYQSALCLAQEKSHQECRRELSHRLRLLPFIRIADKHLFKTEYYAFASVSYRFRLWSQPQMAKTKLKLPIEVEDFRRAQ